MTKITKTKYYQIILTVWMTFVKQKNTKSN